MAERKCPICGAQIPGDIIGGLCPRCVLKEARKEPASAGGGDRPIGLILKIALVLALLALVVPVAKLAARKRAPTPGQTVDTQPAPRPGDAEAQHQLSQRLARLQQAKALAIAAGRSARRVRTEGRPPAGVWPFVGWSSNSDYLVTTRVPELRFGWDGVLAHIEQAIFYRVPAQYYEELRSDVGQIAAATNLLKQSEAELQTLEAALAKNHQDYLRDARTADAQRQDEASEAAKRLLDLQALYLERKRDFEEESASIQPQLQDAPAVFERKVGLYEQAVARYAADMKELESAIYTLQKERYATNQVLQGVSRNIEAAWEQSAQEAIGRLNVASNRLQERLETINTMIRDYNAKLARYGSPSGTSR